MERIYSTLYQCIVEHTFYTSGVSADLSFQLMGNTSKFLRAHGLTFVPTTNGFDIVYRTDVGGLDPFVEITENNKLFIGITVDNVELFNITDLPAKTDSSDIYFLNELYSVGALNLSSLAVRSPKFSEVYSYNSSSASFTVEDVDGNVVFEQRQGGLQDETDLTLYHYSFSVDLGMSLEMGQYKLSTFLNGALEDETDVFIFNKFDYPEIIGVFELELDENIVYDNALPYEAAISLLASTAVWTYNIEMTRNFTNGVVNIVDSLGGLIFNETTVLPDYLLGEVAEFESSISITKSDTTVGTLDLITTSDDQDLTITGLPNPSPYIANSTVYLKI